MSQATLPLEGGHCSGPLFAPPVKRKPPIDRSNGWKWRKGIENRATPEWADLQAIRNVYRMARELTLETGITHSADHVVPLQHPLVCGLHVAHNLSVMPLADNIRKSNNYWPDMWGQQLEIKDA